MKNTLRLVKRKRLIPKPHPIMKTNMSEFIFITIYSEKIPNKGEDAEPLLKLEKNGVSILGVFDGLGGAGSTIYEENGVTRSGAYIAARIAKEVTLKTLTSQQFRNAKDITKNLRDKLASTLQQKAVALNNTPSKLKSSLIKRLPTTAAIIFFQQKNNLSLDCLSMWAGDSRGYCLTPTEGLCQITQDDLKSGDDALDNLLNDSPLSNYINADTDFILNHRFFNNFDSPCVLLVATDGCFNYVPTPMHFEFLLLKTLSTAKTQDEWQHQLKEELVKITCDDVSMALAAIGWSDFNSFQQCFENRYQFILKKYIDEFNEIDGKIKSLEQELAVYKLIREKKRMDLWIKYKTSYEALIKK
jgi:serine/threonine protein phosphatase PrpC